MPEIFGGPSVVGVEDRSLGILGENRALGWKPLPPGAPEFVMRLVTEHRQRVLDGLSVEKRKQYAECTDQTQVDDQAARLDALKRLSF